MPVFIVQLALSLLLLGGGAYLLSAALVKLTGALKFKPEAVLLIALYAASAPLFFIAANASYTGSPDLALGSVTGAVIGGALLVPGLWALRGTVPAPEGSWKKTGGIEVSAAALVLVLASDAVLSRGDGLVLLAAFVVHTAALLRKREFMPAVSALPVMPTASCSTWCAAAYAFVGLALLMTGSGMAAGGALGLSRQIGISGTGAAMLAPGITAALLLLVCPMARRREEIIPFALSSNSFALLGILGVSSFINPLPAFDQAMLIALPAMLAACVALLAILRVSRRLGPAQGVLLLALFAAWVIYQCRLTLHLYA